MNCPCCGIDIEKWLSYQERLKKERKRREEFEKNFGGFLKPARRKKRFTNFLTWAVLSALLFSGLMVWMFYSDLGFLVNHLRQFLVSIVVMGVVGGFWACVTLDAINSKEEKKLWEEFCLTHPIE